MNKKLGIVWLIMVVLIIASLIIISLRRSGLNSNMPGTHLDQLNIKTDNPQPAGKNLSPTP